MLISLEMSCLTMSKTLQAARKQNLDNMIRELHDGKLPGEN